MARIDKHLTAYSAFHRNHTNEATHLVGIPAIVLAMVLWATMVPLGIVGGATVDLGIVLIAAVSIFYIYMSAGLGLMMAAILIGMYALSITVLGRNGWIALGLFVGGWVLQFIGHHYEGKRPAFTTNFLHLLIGPIYILDRALSRARLTPAKTSHE